MLFREITNNGSYISFFGKDGVWSEPKNMGKIINSFLSMSAGMSPNGKYLFFSA